MKKYFSSPEIHVIGLEPESVIVSSSADIRIADQSLDGEDSQRGNSRGGIWDDM